MAVNNASEETWKKVVMAYFNVLSQHSPGGTNEKRVIAQDGLCCRHSNRASSNTSHALQLEPNCSSYLDVKVSEISK
jgi:hypothetical protein